MRRRVRFLLHDEAALGPTGSAQGSWLVSARQSYLEWPPERSASTRTPFGFSDGLAKVVFDVRRTQQLALTAIGGITGVDDDEDSPAPGELAEGTNRVSAFSLSWRSTFGPAFVIRQQASVVTQGFHRTEHGERETDRGINQAVAYRAELSRAVPGGLFEAGAQVERTTARQSARSPDSTPFHGSSWQRSGFAHLAWAATPSLTISPGVRVTWSTLVRTPTVSRWVLAQWSFRPGWHLLGSAGASRQVPELAHVLGDAGSPELRPERAAHLDVGIEQQLTRGVRWQATVFARDEADVLRAPDIHPRLMAGALVFPVGERYANALRGTSRGVELLVSRRSPLGLSGWAAYSYGRTRQTDAERGETYWAEFDQRHTFNLFAVYRFSPSASAGATLRAGSNVPISGYLATSNGRLLVSTVRNQVRLPPYARLDLRADRQLPPFGRRLTLFVEALNVLNRANAGIAGGSVDPRTGEATGFTDTPLRRRIAAGVVIEF